jgi:hypothetical protein
VAQLGLEALGQREEVEYSGLLGHEVALLAASWRRPLAKARP